MKKLATTAVIPPMLAGCDRIDTLLWEPNITPEQWCESMPCVELFSSGMTLTQPSSTILIYFLGLIWLWAGWRFWHLASGQKSRLWWSISMALGGIAAISAGTSYQAFGFEFKCAEREFCTWTSWWEIAYLTLQIGSVNAMLAGVAYACADGLRRRLLLTYGIVNTIIYCFVAAAGAFLPNRFMISFEMLIMFSTPAFFACFLINGWGYISNKSDKNKILLRAWIIMFLTNVFYYGYLLLGYTQTLWSKGVWFSENDVLHVLMLIWVWYVGTAVVSIMNDSESSASLMDDSAYKNKH